MADFSRDPREHWLKPRFSKNEVANSGYTKCSSLPLAGKTKDAAPYPGFSDRAMAERLIIRRCGAGSSSLRAFSGTPPTGLSKVNGAAGFRFREDARTITHAVRRENMCVRRKKFAGWVVIYCEGTSFDVLPRNEHERHEQVRQIHWQIHSDN